MTVLAGTTRNRCFVWYPVGVWGYERQFRARYYKKSPFCVVPDVIGSFFVGEGVVLKYIILYLRYH